MKATSTRATGRPVGWIKLAAFAGTVVVALGLMTPGAFAWNTVDVHWFGWVTQSGSSHRVCGEADTWSGNVYGESDTWYQGYGQTDPGCNKWGDAVGAGWVGVQVKITKNGSICHNGKWSYNSVPAYGIGLLEPCGSSSSGNYQTLASHQWWGLDCGCYAGGTRASPILSQ